MLLKLRFYFVKYCFFEQIQPQKRQEQSTEYCVWRGPSRLLHIHVKVGKGLPKKN
jgi:hypothetical protein